MFDNYCPCIKACPNRSEKCRLNCDKYKVYTLLKKMEYANKPKLGDGIYDGYAHKHKHSKQHFSHKKYQHKGW